MSDTIAAIATAPGQGSVSIVRLSGDGAERILRTLFRPRRGTAERLPSHRLTYGRIEYRTGPDGAGGVEAVDECMAVIMRAPASYTREDVVEFQVHGGSYTAQRVLELCLSAGARLAEPGEFTRRAFLNGRIDLSQAEAVMGVIQARGSLAHDRAMRQMMGRASGFVRRMADMLYDIEAGAAACIDYPEEIGEEEAVGSLVPECRRLIRLMEEACDERAVHIINEGLTAALCGRPNVGKSSLLNALLGEERAIVTPIPGTTRDMVQGELLLDGCVIHLVDTAGVRGTDDPVEAIGVARAGKAIDAADLPLLVLDAGAPLTDEDRALAARLRGRDAAVVLNKSDLPSVVTAQEAQALLPGAPLVRVSAADAASLAPLKALLREKARVSDLLEVTQPRHLEAVREAIMHVREAVEAIETGNAPLDVAMLDLQYAQQALGRITGDNVEEGLLDRVFSRFCVGK